MFDLIIKKTTVKKVTIVINGSDKNPEREKQGLFYFLLYNSLNGATLSKLFIECFKLFFDNFNVLGNFVGR